MRIKTLQVSNPLFLIKNLNFIGLFFTKHLEDLSFIRVIRIGQLKNLLQQSILNVKSMDLSQFKCARATFTLDQFLTPKTKSLKQKHFTLKLSKFGKSIS